MADANFNNALRLAAKRMQDQRREASYRTDPVAWAEDKLGVVLWSKQKEVLRSLVKHKRTAVKSCHSSGKTFLSGIAACWFISTREDCMVQSTAPTYQQVHTLLWEEIRKMHLKANLKGRTLGDDTWVVQMEHQGRAKDTVVGEGKKPADSNIHGFQGTHRPDGVLAILDEAGGIAQAIYTGAEAISTATIDRQLAVGNPDDPNTRFGELFLQNNSEWNLITISVYDTPHFTGEAAELIAWANEQDKNKELVAVVNQRDGTDEREPHLKKVMALLDHMPDPEWVESRIRDWGEDSPRVKSKIYAEFPLTTMDSLFSAADIEMGRNTVIVPADTDFRVLAVDVARYGTDKTVIISNAGGHIEIAAVYPTMDLMEIAANVHKLAIKLNIDQIRVDGIGVGGGVVDRLSQLAHTAPTPYIVVEMTASASPPDRTLHRNSRAYWYDAAEIQLKAGTIDLPVGETIEFADGTIKSATEHAQTLMAELGRIRYSYPNGVMLIESKEDMRKRGENSPDFADAFIMAVAPISYIVNDPLATYRPGDKLEIDIMDDFEMVSPY